MIDDLLSKLVSSEYLAGETDGSIADQIYRQLRRELLLGEFPYGERLVEESLAERFACSRTPVREAMHRLQADGHLVRHPVSGITPAPPQATAIRELYELRIVIEDLAVRRASKEGDRERLEMLRDSWRSLGEEVDRLKEPFERPEFVYADEAFHEGVAIASGNAAASRFLRDINERIRVLRVHDFTTSDRLEATIAEHVEIADAILAGHADAASALMRVHIDRSARVVEQRVGAMLARMFDTGGEV